MTREEREKAIAFLKDMQECTYDGLEEIRNAIKALEQESTTKKDLDISIGQAIEDMIAIRAYFDGKAPSADLAIEIMQKYQNIEYIMKNYCSNPIDCLFRIRGILER